MREDAYFQWENFGKSRINEWHACKQPFYVKGNIFISMYNNEKESSSVFDVDIIWKAAYV